MIIAVNFPIQAIEKKKPEKIRASTGFEAVTSAKYRCDALPIELWSHTISMCCYSMSFHMDFKTGLFRRPTTTFFRLFFQKKWMRSNTSLLPLHYRPTNQIYFYTFLDLSVWNSPKAIWIISFILHIMNNCNSIISIYAGMDVFVSRSKPEV